MLEQLQTTANLNTDNTLATASAKYLLAFSVAFFDPSLAFDAGAMLNGSGMPPFYERMYVPVVKETVLLLGFDIYHIIDKTSSSKSPNPCPKALATNGECHYYRYVPRVTNVSKGSAPASNSSSDELLNFVTFGFGVPSGMINTYTIDHGTSTMKILTDEGGILGAILFLTWFLGIFIA